MFKQRQQLWQYSRSVGISHVCWSSQCLLLRGQHRTLVYYYNRSILSFFHLQEGRRYWLLQCSSQVLIWRFFHLFALQRAHPSMGFAGRLSPLSGCESFAFWQGNLARPEAQAAQRHRG